MTQSVGRLLQVLLLFCANPDFTWAQEMREAKPETVFSETLDWKRVVRGFRRDHNFSLNLSYATHRWDGTLQKTSESFSFETEALELQLGYNFHLPLIGSLGYTLGTHAAIIYDERAKDHEHFSLQRTYGLPGIEVGLVWNITERWRLLTTFTYGWQRVERMQVRTPFTFEKIAITGDTRSYRLSLDYFYQLTWAMRLEAEDLDFYYSSKESLELEKKAFLLRLGFVKHLI